MTTTSQKRFNIEERLQTIQVHAADITLIHNKLEGYSENAKFVRDPYRDLQDIISQIEIPVNDSRVTAGQKPLSVQKLDMADPKDRLAVSYDTLMMLTNEVAFGDYLPDERRALLNDYITASTAILLTNVRLPVISEKKTEYNQVDEVRDLIEGITIKQDIADIVNNEKKPSGRIDMTIDGFYKGHKLTGTAHIETYFEAWSEIEIEGLDKDEADLISMEVTDVILENFIQLTGFQDVLTEESVKAIQNENKIQVEEHFEQEAKKGNGLTM